MGLFDFGKEGVVQHRLPETEKDIAEIKEIDLSKEFEPFGAERERASMDIERLHKADDAVLQRVNALRMTLLPLIAVAVLTMAFVVIAIVFHLAWLILAGLCLAVEGGCYYERHVAKRNLTQARKKRDAIDAETVRRTNEYRKLLDDIRKFNTSVNAVKKVLMLGDGAVQTPPEVVRRLRDTRAQLLQTARSHLLTQATLRYCDSVKDPGPVEERFTADLTRQVFAVQLLQNAEEVRRSADPMDRLLRVHDEAEESALEAEFEVLETVRVERSAT